MTKTPNGKAVRSAKSSELAGTTEKKPAPADNKIAIHAGNIGVLTVQLLGEINKKLGILVAALEKENV